MPPPQPIYTDMCRNAHENPAKHPTTLYTPIRVGNMLLRHRIACAPMTRMRATRKGHVPLEFVPTYYAQRAHCPGTFIISEATLISPEAGGLDHVPGIWTDEQIDEDVLGHGTFVTG